MNNEKFKFTSISQAARNFIIIISRINNNYQYTIMFTFSNNNISTLFNYTYSISLFYNTLTFFVFLFNSNSLTSIFVNELITNSTAQKIWLSNALNANVKIELKRTFNYYAKFRSTKNLSINLFIKLIVLFNCDLIVIKIVLTLFVKIFFTNFHELKLYKKAIVDAQHKIN